MINRNHKGCACFQHLLYLQQVSTTLVSMNDEKTLYKNLQAALDPLTEHEICVRDHILQTYFTPMRVKHWEGVEVAKYREKLNSL